MIRQIFNSSIRFGKQIHKISIFIIAILAVNIAVQYAAAETLRIGYFQAEPYSYPDDNGHHRG